MSEEFTKHLVSLGIACSRTTPYNPQGNGQVERLNGTLWKTIQLSLRSKRLDATDWERALPVALHSIRSLLCTSTNATPHERMFSHPRRSPNGVSLPAWLMVPGPILIRKNVRNSKFEPLVEKGELLQSNPTYSYVRYPDGREGTISNRHLAPFPSADDDLSSDDEDANEDPESAITEERPAEAEQADHGPRRSTRPRRSPVYLADYQGF